MFKTTHSLFDNSYINKTSISKATIMKKFIKCVAKLTAFVLFVCTTLNLNAQQKRQLNSSNENDKSRSSYLTSQSNQSSQSDGIAQEVNALFQTRHSNFEGIVDYKIPRVENEMIDRRTEFSYFVDNQNGTHSETASNMPKNYLVNGEWVPIDYSIVESSNSPYPLHTVVNESNPMKSYFSTNLTNGFRTVFEKGNHFADMLNAKMFFEDANGNILAPQNINQSTSPTYSGSNVLKYVDAYSGINLDIQIDAAVRKLNYVIEDESFVNGIPDEAEYIVFEEYFTGTNLYAIQVDKEILILSETNEELIATIPAPIVRDNSNKKLSQDDFPISEFILEESNGMYKLQLRVGTDWIKSQQRNFPIFIDPTTAGATTSRLETPSSSCFSGSSTISASTSASGDITSVAWTQTGTAEYGQWSSGWSSSCINTGSSLWSNCGTSGWFVTTIKASTGNTYYACYGSGSWTDDINYDGFNATNTWTFGLVSNDGYEYSIYGGSFDVTVTYSPNYCTPAPSSVDGSGITNVSAGTIDNATGSESGNYANYSAQSTDVDQGTNLDVDITYSTGYTYVTKIWVDWNNDFDFDDAGEEVYSGTSNANNPTTLAASFTVPADASVGSHRMRIGGTDYGPPTPCYTSTYGSYEDYTINVTAPATPTISSLDLATICEGGTLTITGTNLSGASAVSVGGTSVSSITSSNATTVVVVVGSGTTGTVSVTTAGGTAVSGTSVTVNALPAAVTVSGAGTYCDNTTLTACC